MTLPLSQIRPLQNSATQIDSQAVEASSAPLPGACATTDAIARKHILPISSFNFCRPQQKTEPKKLPILDFKSSTEAFTQPSEHVQFPISEIQYKALTEKAQHLYQYIAERQSWGLNQIQAYVQKISTLSEQPNVPDLLSLGYLAYKLMFGVQPYSTQIITILALLSPSQAPKGALAQVHTGEGKTLIVTLTALTLALQKRNVDLISSSPYLAKRDYQKYAKFFEVFGITTSHISEHEPPEQRFLAQIIYGTNYDFEFALLRAWLPSSEHSETRKQTILNRGFDCALVDEVDNLFVDTALNSARIAQRKPYTRSWLWPILLEFVRTHSEKIRGLSLLMKALKQMRSFSSTEQQQLDSVSELMKQYLISSFPDIKDRFQPISKDVLVLWIDSAFTALYTLKEGEDYVIKETSDNKDEVPQRRVIIIDKNNTGRQQEHSRWSYGLHQLLECKHGLIPEEEDMMPASISHSEFFKKYKNIYGLSGTIGERCEREEIETLYGVTCFDIPTHKPCRGRELAPYIATTQEQHREFILEQCRLIRQAQRPCLILFQTITESEEFASFLRSKNITSQVLNDVQLENEDTIIKNAGEAGSITIATNTAGRGTDIVLSPSALLNGGLHVIVTFFPENERVQAQAFGRAARQGQEGSYQMVLCCTTSSEPSEITFQQLVKDRHEKIETLSKWRKQYAAIQAIQGSLLEDFLNHFLAWQKEISNDWFIDFSHGLLNVTQESILIHAMQSLRKKLTDSILVEWSEKVYEQTCLLEKKHTSSPIQEVENQFKQLYNDFFSHWQEAFDHPKDHFLAQFQKTLSSADIGVPEKIWSEIRDFHLLIHLQKILDDIFNKMNLQSYWIIDPRYWIQENATSSFRSGESEQIHLIKNATDAQQLIQKLRTFRDETIPQKLQLFNGWTNFEPLILAKQAVEVLPEKITKLIAEFEQELSHHPTF